MPDFQKHLIGWYDKNRRDFPWRGTKNPYFIWLSEVILQQTRALQGLPYYTQFTQLYPTVEALANAPLDDVMKTWQGLGYYSRARNLHATAQLISDEYKGKFPVNYDGLIQLKGIGPYTAAAIASFAYKEKKAVVDGNVYRVLSRYFNDYSPIDSTIGKKHFQSIADSLISDKHPDLFNQAIMELGATVCTPKQYKCDVCPLQESCLALKERTITELPVKAKKTKVTNRYFNYFILKKDECFVLKKRTKKDIWQGLYEFPNIDKREPITEQDIQVYLKDRGLQTINHTSETIKHILSHQHLHVKFIHVAESPNVLLENEELVHNFEEHALPRVIDKYLEQIL